MQPSPGLGDRIRSIADQKWVQKLPAEKSIGKWGGHEYTFGIKNVFMNLGSAADTIEKLGKGMSDSAKSFKAILLPSNKQDSTNRIFSSLVMTKKRSSSSDSTPESSVEAGKDDEETSSSDKVISEGESSSEEVVSHHEESEAASDLLDALKDLSPEAREKLPSGLIKNLTSYKSLRERPSLSPEDGAELYKAGAEISRALAQLPAQQAEGLSSSLTPLKAEIKNYNDTMELYTSELTFLSEITKITKFSGTSETPTTFFDYCRKQGVMTKKEAEKANKDWKTLETVIEKNVATLGKLSNPKLTFEEKVKILQGLSFKNGSELQSALIPIVSNYKKHTESFTKLKNPKNPETSQAVLSVRAQAFSTPVQRGPRYSMMLDNIFKKNSSEAAETLKQEAKAAVETINASL